MPQNEVEKYTEKLSVVPQEFMNQVSLFQSKLNVEPNDNELEINKFAKKEDGSPVYYLPIGLIEKKLDEIYSGLYRISIVETRQVANEFIVVARIEYFHPVAGVWLHRDGIGACQIRWKKDVDITDLNGKIKNALAADAPHAYAEAVKNAAKKIGNLFGRNINRDDDYSEYESIDDFLSDFDILDKEIIEKELMECETKEDFKAIWNKYPDFQKNPLFKSMLLKERRKKGV